MAEWERLRTLGEGSFGTVYQAIVKSPQEAKGAVIAVKRSKCGRMYSLQREGKILQSFIGCEEVIQCYEQQYTRENDDLVYNLLLEFSPHGSLGDLIRKRPLTANEVRLYTRMLLKGLSSIHQNGIVHCDLKPDNILLFPFEEGEMFYQLKISDFGLSKTKDEVVVPNPWRHTFRGTPIYMSPESVIGVIETPLDIWSLGCVIIEMFTGRHVWQNACANDIMMKLAVDKEAPTIPKELNEECKDFLEKCFVKNPSKRWSAKMLLNHPFLSPGNNTSGGCIDEHPVASFAFFSHGDCLKL